MLVVERVEVDRCQQQRRETALADQIGDRFAQEGVKQGGAEDAEQFAQFGTVEAGGLEFAGLLHFDQIGGALAQFHRDGGGDGDFVQLRSEHQGLVLQADVDLGVPLFLVEDLRSVGAFEGDVLGVDAADGERLLPGFARAVARCCLVVFSHAGSSS